ncbi:hypothetical protein EX30DRAFT_365201 [Ascodesmis nigricans]|uniref:Uncharacterized protein n=1 Tax=Ascodesmis nigricans TaxID=341454 RepID=A0A4S2MT74_9PEZI|nr:hypothetical protein EX30DRAFT_365201 [Ascodesmis nigricans]
MSDRPPPSLHRPGALRRSPVPLVNPSPFLHTDIHPPSSLPAVSPSHFGGSAVPDSEPKSLLQPSNSLSKPVHEFSTKGAPQKSGDLWGQGISKKPTPTPQPVHPAPTKSTTQRDDVRIGTGVTEKSRPNPLRKPTPPKIHKPSPPRIHKSQPSKSPSPSRETESTYATILRARIEALEKTNNDLLRQIEAERSRIEAQKQQEKLQDDIISRLLAANDSSLPAVPSSTATAPRWDFQLALAPGDIPSVKPLPFGLPELTAFSRLRFDTVSTTPVPSEGPNTTGTTVSTTIKGRVDGTGVWFHLTWHTTTVPSPSNATEPDIFISSIPYISLPAWTHPELNSLITETAHTRDISHLLYSISSYASLAQLRARTWKSLSLPAAPGRRVVVIPVPIRGNKRGVELVVKWDIEVDDVGEARSVVEGDVRVPRKWREGREGEWRGLGGLFRGLVRERGVMEAVRGVGRVVAGKQ